MGGKLDQTDRAKQEKADIENIKRKITIKVKDLKAFCEGTVGWVMDRTLYIFPNGAEVPIRHTYVFHQENGEWKAVHVHYSIGVPNEEIGVRSDA